MLRERYLAQAFNFVDRKRNLAPPEMRVLRANSSFATARVVGLSDWSHLADESHGVIRSSLRDMIKPEDTLLLEGLARGETALSGYRKKPRKRKQSLARGETALSGYRVLGWDDMEAYEEGRTAYIEYFNTQSVLNEVQKATKSRDHKAARLLLDEFNAKRQTLEARIEAAVKSRNQSMAEALRTSLEQFTDGRIFIVGGEAHFLSNKPLLAVMRTTRFTIMTPKDRKETKRSQEEIDTLLNRT